MTSSEIAIMSVVASVFMISGDNTIFVILSSLSVKLVLVRRVVVAKAPLRVVPVTSFCFFRGDGGFQCEQGTPIIQTSFIHSLAFCDLVLLSQSIKIS